MEGRYSYLAREYRFRPSVCPVQVTALRPGSFKSQEFCFSSLLLPYRRAPCHSFPSLVEKVDRGGRSRDNQTGFYLPEQRLDFKYEVCSGQTKVQFDKIEVADNVGMNDNNIAIGLLPRHLWQRLKFLQICLY